MLKTLEKEEIQLSPCYMQDRDLSRQFNDTKLRVWLLWSFSLIDRILVFSVSIFSWPNRPVIFSLWWPSGVKQKIYAFTLALFKLACRQSQKKLHQIYLDWEILIPKSLFYLYSANTTCKNTKHTIIPTELGLKSLAQVSKK